MVIKISEDRLTPKQCKRVKKALRILKSIGIKPTVQIGSEVPPAFLGVQNERGWYYINLWCDH